MPTVWVKKNATPFQGILTEGEGSVRLTSSHQLVQISCFSNWNCTFIFYKTTHINEEVNCTEPSLSARVPWPFISKQTKVGIITKKAKSGGHIFSFFSSIKFFVRRPFPDSNRRCLIIVRPPVANIMKPSAPLYGRLLALPANIRLGWKGKSMTAFRYQLP